MTEGLVIVVAGQSNDRPPPAEEWEEDLLQVGDRLAQGIRPTQVAEQVPRDEQQVNRLALAITGDPLDPPAQVVGPVDPAEAVAQVPVGSVQDPHRCVHLRGPSGRRVGHAWAATPPSYV